MVAHWAEGIECIMVVGRKEVVEVTSTMANLYKQSHMTLFMTFGPDQYLILQ